MKMYDINFHAHDHVWCVIILGILYVVSLKTYFKFQGMRLNDLMKNIVWEYLKAVLSLMSRNHFDVRDTLTSIFKISSAQIHQCVSECRH